MKQKPPPKPPPPPRSIRPRTKGPLSDVEIQRQCMNAADQVGTKRLMHGAVPRNPGQPLEMGRPNFHIKMTFTPLAEAAMSTVAFTIVNDA